MALKRCALAGLFHVPLWRLRRRVVSEGCVWWAPTKHTPHLKEWTSYRLLVISLRSLDEHEKALAPSYLLLS
ncbi:hypothetical protein KDK_76780 [Dictyobacter kobayashii]|uniref:Uncharacterized protein n=1 Tax=Dictyobacter kobayashii TaxID=2014872 RepID=A0A402AXR2_9CHLR|nr:hypothetical protein KDK_76780 [Dictyobacter kobayashii]